MQGTVLYAPRDVRFEEREEPKIAQPTDAIIRLSATCICGSDLWPYRVSKRLLSPHQWATSTAASSKRWVERSGTSDPGSSSWVRLRPLTTLAPSAATAINPPACIASS